jgi:hypothetical protein
MPDHVRFSVRNAFLVFLLCFLALASELGQYVAGYWQACSHRNEMEKNEQLRKSDRFRPRGHWCTFK